MVINASVMKEFIVEKCLHPSKLFATEARSKQGNPRQKTKVRTLAISDSFKENGRAASSSSDVMTCGSH